MDKIKGFFYGVVKEGKKSHWPKGKELINYSVVSIVLIIFFALFFYGLDNLFSIILGGAR